MRLIIIQSPIMPGGIVLFTEGERHGENLCSAPDDTVLHDAEFTGELPDDFPVGRELIWTE